MHWLKTEKFIFRKWHNFRKVFHVKKLLIIILLLVVGKSFAQTDTLEIHYFKSGKLSSIQLLENNRFGKAVAYNELGEIIFEQSIRRIGGHASVYFSYYDSGAIKKAEYSSAPDGGIQWYKSYYEFNEKGERTNFYEMSHEGLTKPFSPSETPTPFVKTPAVSLENHEVLIVNNSKYTIILEMTRNGGKETLILEKRKTHQIENIWLNQETDLSEKFSFTYTIPNAKRANSVQLKKMRLDGKDHKILHLYTFDN